MDENDIQEKINLNVNEIGYIARLIDQEMTIYDRMKIKKTSLTRIAGALIIYIIIMSVFAFLL